MGSEQMVSLFVWNAHILYTRFELNSFNYKIRHKSCFESNTIEEKMNSLLESWAHYHWPMALGRTQNPEHSFPQYRPPVWEINWGMVYWIGWSKLALIYKTYMCYWRLKCWTTDLPKPYSYCMRVEDLHTSWLTSCQNNLLLLFELVSYQVSLNLFHVKYDCKFVMG